MKMEKNEMSINEIKAMYFDEKALMVSPVPLYRYEHKGDRFYYYIEPTPELDPMRTYDAQDKPPVRFAVGVTTLTRKTIPQDEFLTKWIADQGYDNAIAYRDLRAKYGSLMHTVTATLAIKRVADLDTFAEVVANYCKVNHVETNQTVWTDDLKQDTLGFAAFMREYNVKPLAIELSLVSPNLGLAGTLDLLCELDITEKGFFGETYASGVNKGQPKETKRSYRGLAIVDMKSGRKSNGGVHHAAQLALLRLLLNENNPDFAAQEIKLYNWHPKDWETKPSYTLIDQTGKFSQNACLNILALYRELYPNVELKRTLEMFGVVDLDAVPDEIHNHSTPLILDIVQTAVNDGTFGQTEYDYTDTYFDENNDE